MGHKLFIVVLITTILLTGCQKENINPNKPRIGFTVEQVEAVLGPPNKSMKARQYYSYWPVGDYLIYTYWIGNYTYIYYFKDNKLFYIEKL